MIKRDYYLNRFISKKENGLIKIIAGIRGFLQKIFPAEFFN